MSKHILGIDGGGTRTRAAIVNETGSLLGVGVGGPTNYDDIGIEATGDNLRQVIHAAWQDTGLEPQQFDTAFLGLAGIVSEDDHRIIRQIAQKLDLAPEAQVGIDHDCRIALAGSLSGRAGIVLIAGTGSACYGRSADGNSWRAGGWGDLLADEGSGGWLGWQALRAAVRSFDGRERPSRLVHDILDLFELRHMDDIMHRIYHVGLSRKERAALAPLVMSAARNNDEVAQQLIHEAVEELALSVWAAATRLEMHDQPEVAIVGGLYNVEDIFAAPLRAAIKNKLPGCHIQPPELSPVIGACLLALQQIGVDPQTITSALRASEMALKATLDKRS
jgi:N-acetylglucosamine kinase-like BadF-type ATPase